MTSDLIEKVAQGLCLADSLNPFERLDASDTYIFRWETYQPRARAAGQIILREVRQLCHDNPLLDTADLDSFARENEIDLGGEDG